jgi:hypothetical protein
MPVGIAPIEEVARIISAVAAAVLLDPCHFCGIYRKPFENQRLGMGETSGRISKLDKLACVAVQVVVFRRQLWV